MRFVAVAEDVEMSLAQSKGGSFSPSPVQILCRVGLVGAVHFFLPVFLLKHLTFRFYIESIMLNQPSFIDEKHYVVKDVTNHHHFPK